MSPGRPPRRSRRGCNGYITISSVSKWWTRRCFRCATSGAVGENAGRVVVLTHDRRELDGVARLHVGCAMWTHKAWPGRFLPQSLPAKERLRAYAGWCNAVEGNTTFYATPARTTVENWAQQTDPGFRFVVKLPKVVTHERRFTGVETE